MSTSSSARLLPAMTPDPILDAADGEMPGLLQELLRSLDELFDDEGLFKLRQERPEHAAIPLYDHIVTYLLRGQIPFHEESTRVASIMTLSFDRSTWASPSRAGSVLDEIPDSTARSYTARTVRDVKKYDDLMAELHVWGWLRAHGFDAQLREGKGPDIFVRTPVEFWAEVKRVSTNDNPKRIRAVIKHASDQIKSVTPADAGVLFVHIRRDGLPVELSPTVDDEIPVDIQPFIAEAKRQIGAPQSRSVALVIVTWDDSAMRDGREDGYRLYVARRRSLALEHKFPRSKPAVTPDSLLIGATVILNIRYPLRSALPPRELDRYRTNVPEVARVEFSQFYIDTNSFPQGVRKNHALKTLHQPDRIIAFRIAEEVHVVLATRYIAAGRSPHVMLLVGSKIQDAAVVIDGGYKLYGTKEFLLKISTDPLLAFQTLIDRYGIEFQVCGYTASFLPGVVAELDPTRPNSIFAVPNGSGDKQLVALAQRVEDGTPKLVRIVWAYALQTDRYRTAAKQQQP